MNSLKIYCLVFSLLLPFSAFSQITTAKKGDNGKYGFVDNMGNWVIRPKYLNAYWSDVLGIGIFSSTSDDYSTAGAVNEKGNIIIPEKYKYHGITQVSGLNGYYYVKKGIGKDEFWGICKDGGEVSIPCKYHSIYPVTGFSGYFIVTIGEVEDKREGMYKDGELIIPCKYKNILPYSNGITVLNESGKYGAYSHSGKLLLEEKYTFPIIIGDGGEDWNRYGILNIGGVQRSDGKLEGGLWGMYSRPEGSVVVPCEYDGAQYAAEDVFAIKKNGKWALFANNSILTPFQFDDPPYFRSGVASVKMNGEVMLIKNPLKGTELSLAHNEINDKKGRKIVSSRYPAPNSDVDVNIPVNKRRNEELFAFIIANENYSDAPVPYALNDGRMFGNYCSSTLGIPNDHIYLYEDASLGEIIAAIEKMGSIADAYDGFASIILYYAGHGFPDEKNNSAYLLPIDGDAKQIELTGISLMTLYSRIANMPLRNAFIFLDACFSGAKREDVMLTSSRGVAIKIKNDVPKGNVVVFSASQGDETAHQLEEKGHGLFTYYLLKGLQQTNGDVNLGDLSDFVTKQVKRQSVVINNKRQTPTVIPSLERFDTWRELNF